MKEKKEVQDLRAQGEMDKKRQSLLQLKQTIDHNKDVLRAKVSKNQFMEKKKLQSLNNEKSLILGRGENPDFYIPRRQKMEEFIVTKQYVDGLFQKKKNLGYLLKEIHEKAKNKH
jgi:hypothetical protein